MFSNKYLEVFLKNGFNLKRLSYLCVMFKIEYGIGLNETGRPCIELPDDYDQNPEDKFFAIEIARYYLQMVQDKMDANTYDQESIEAMDITTRLLGQIGDEMAEITFNNMRAMGETTMLFDNRYHVMVKTTEERDALPDKNIVYNNRIYDRVEGLKVGLQYYDEETFLPQLDVYELVDGITNENWVKL